MARPKIWALAAVLLLAVACGGDSDDGSSEAVPSGTQAPAMADVLSDLVAGSDGHVYIAGPAGIAVLDPDGDGVALDLDDIPAGSGAGSPEDWPAELPGRWVQELAMDPAGAVWAAGVSMSAIDDEPFGGEANPFFDSRLLEWIARGACDAPDCRWQVTTSDRVPALGTGDLGVGQNGISYSIVEERSLLVGADSDWDLVAGPGPRIASLAVGPDGVVWLGCERGLYSFDGERFTRHSIDGVLPSAELHVSIDGDGRVWVSAEGGGLAVFDGTRWTGHTTDDGLLSADVEVAVGPGPTVWAVHDDGYSRFDGSSWTSHPSDQPLGGSTSVVALDGSLWSIVDDPDHTGPIIESWLVSFDGTTETVHPSPFR